MGVSLKSKGAAWSSIGRAWCFPSVSRRRGCLRFRGAARAMDVGRIMQDQRRIWKQRFVENHQEFQVPKMEVLTLIRLVWGWVFPYISRIHTAYIGEDSSILGT